MAAAYMGAPLCTLGTPDVAPAGCAPSIQGVSSPIQIIRATMRQCQSPGEMETMRERKPHSSAPDSTGTGMRRRMEESYVLVSRVSSCV